MKDQTSHASLVGTAEIGFVDQVLDAVEDLCSAPRDISDEDRTFFSLAVSEVVTNIVTHCDQDSGVTVRADLAVNQETLRAQFHDDAKPVDIPLDEAVMPEELAESGRGLAIAKMALDELSHKVNDGHIWTLVRNRRPTR
ncbi:ATP-binding protein [Nesterenkonia sp. Act20]|uniref:ATP-binding protein n=1 Tax=Nesterenkonia sp. Act20 TaxID=1483432 RepID=UPI001C447C62|nr:ATP-binding protein [Nesterenkonia sp. Act20]